MTNFTKQILVSALTLAVSIILIGCGKPEGTQPGEAHSEDDGHGHSEEIDSHAGHEHESAGSDEHDQDEPDSHGTIEIAGSTFSVAFSSDVQPSSEVQLNLVVETGPIPIAVRFWVGDEAGNGALKSKTDAHDNHFHGQSEAPVDLTGASLWIEVETADGKRQAQSVPLD